MYNRVYHPVSAEGKAVWLAVVLKAYKMHQTYWPSEKLMRAAALVGYKAFWLTGAVTTAAAAAAAVAVTATATTAFYHCDAHEDLELLQFFLALSSNNYSGEKKKKQLLSTFRLFSSL